MLRTGLQQIINSKRLAGCVFGNFSVFHIYFGECEMSKKCDRRVCLNQEKTLSHKIGNALAINLALNGIHMPPSGLKGFISAAHTEQHIEKTIAVFDFSLETMIEENLLSQAI